MSEWLWVFALTAAMDLVVVTLAAPAGLRRRAALDSLLANLATQPLGWYCVGERLLDLWGCKAIAALLEAVVYREVTGMTRARALFVAFIANFEPLQLLVP